MPPGNDPASQILQVLKFKPRGMTITEIAKITGIKRNSAAKYLEMLRATGKVDMRPVGSARIFSIAQRVPLSAFLCFTQNFIVVLDSKEKIIQINDKFLAYAGIRKERVIGKTLPETPLPIISSRQAQQIIRNPDTKQVVSDIRYQGTGSDSYFQMQVIPTILEDGEHGRTIVLEDVTLRKSFVRNMEFLARTAMELVEMPPETDIYRFIADRINEIEPGARVAVNFYDEDSEKFIIRAIADTDFHASLKEILGFDPIGLEFPLQQIFSPSFGEEYIDNLKQGFMEFPLTSEAGPGVVSMYDFCFHTIPKDICDEFLTSLKVVKVSAALLFWRGQLFGVVVIFLGGDEYLKNKEAIESFIRQCSIAINQRITAERLRRSEERFREVVDFSPNPAAIIDKDGQYLFVNRVFTDVFGYTIEDIPTGRAWFRAAYPERQYREKAIETWKTDLDRAKINEIRPRTFQVKCKNGKFRKVLFQPVTLRDGLQFITYLDISGG